jgi:hypothetical protein
LFPSSESLLDELLEDEDLPCFESLDDESDEDDLLSFDLLDEDEDDEDLSASK